MFSNRVIFQTKGEDSYRQIVHKEDLKEILEEFELTEDDVEIIPIAEATAEDYAQLLGEELEGANQHSIVSLPDELLAALKVEGFDAKDQSRVLRVLTVALEPLLGS